MPTDTLTSPQDQTQASGDVPAPQKPQAPKSKRPVILAAAAAVAVVGVTAWWWLHRGFESTDNAQVDADMVLIPARAGGLVAKVLFEENQTVKAGDLLAQLDDDQAKARLAQAEANLAAAEATAKAAEADAVVAETNASGNQAIAQASYNTAEVSASSAGDQIAEAASALRSAEATLRQATADSERNRRLVGEGAISRLAFDQGETARTVAQNNVAAARARLATAQGAAAQARSRVNEAEAKVVQTGNVGSIAAQARAKAESARSQVATAKAARDLAALDLSYTRIEAPSAGIVSKKSINVGQTVTAGQTIVQLVSPEVWVTANFKETQVAHMHEGQPAEFSVDAFPGQTFHGVVESLSGATGSRFTLLPPDNATGNFTKVVQRLPVKVKVTELPPNVHLRPGMSVELTVDARQ